MHTQSVLAEPHFGQRVERLLAAKLGRCRRCLTWSAVLLVATWALVVGLTASAPDARVPIVAATLLATPFTALALAHATAFVLIRRGRFPAPPPAEAGDSDAPASRRGCNCGSSRSGPQPVAGRPGA